MSFPFRRLLLVFLLFGLLSLYTGCQGMSKAVTFGSHLSTSGKFIFVRAPYGMTVRKSAGFLIHPQTRLCFIWINVSVGDGNGTGLSRVPCRKLLQDPRIAPYLSWLHPPSRTTPRKPPPARPQTRHPSPPPRPQTRSSTKPPLPSPTSPPPSPRPRPATSQPAPQ